MGMVAIIDLLRAAFPSTRGQMPLCIFLAVRHGNLGFYFRFNTPSAVSHNSLPSGSRRMNGCLPCNSRAARRTSSCDANRRVEWNAPLIGLLGMSFHSLIYEPRLAGNANSVSLGLR
jgi:hypothetical protein